jgi:hypothetical protein
LSAACVFKILAAEKTHDLSAINFVHWRPSSH